MKQIWSGIQIAFTAFGGFLGWFLGGVDGFLYALIAFTVIDYITGVMCAITDKNLSSSIGFKGICRKVLIFTLVGIGNIVDVYVLGQGGVLRTAVIFFYRVLANAKVAADKNPGTYVFTNEGVAIYPTDGTSETGTDDYRIHTVVKGDTLWDIATLYLGKGSRYLEIKTLNGLKSNVIYSGWKLKIPN